jgi:DNA-binding SARP family transcriptional activator/tetratricopeptide (TPR) repeat protein
VLDVLLRVLGPVEVHTDDGRILTLPRRQERCLLAILLLDAGRAISLQRLSDLLWDDPPPKAHQALRTYVARIRTVLAQAGGADHDIALVAAHGGYLIRVDPDLVDALRFRRLLVEATASADLADRDRLLGEALALWRGPALHRAATDQLRERLCADLDELHLHAREESLATGIELGRHRDLLPHLARLTAEHPDRERIVELHMLALHRAGRTTDALDLYARTRKRLAEEFGLDPGKALQDLHQAILRGDQLGTGQPPPASAGHTWVRPALLPADLPTFIGRREPLKQLDRLLARGTTAAVIATIAGTAGIGKTALAVHWAHRLRPRFPDGQLYINLRGFDPAGSLMAPTEAVRRFLDALQVPTQRIPTNPDAQVDLYRSLLADKRMLIVLDNARDTTQVRPLLPGTPGCLVLVTSRNQLTGLVAADGAHAITLDLLSMAEARELLIRRLGHDQVVAEPDAVEQIIVACARLPLALAIVAARAATDPHLPLATLAGWLRDARDRLGTLVGDDPHTDLKAVFSWSYQALTPAAAQLFRLLGLHPGPDLSAAAAASLAAIPGEQAQLLLTELVQANLLIERTPGRYTLHDLLRTYAVDLTRDTDREQERRTAIHRLLDHYLHSAFAADRLLVPTRAPIDLPPPEPGSIVDLPADHEDALAWFTVEHAVLLAVLDHAAATGFDHHTWQLAWTLYNFLDWRGHWYDWAAVGRAAVAAAGRVGDPVVHGQARRNLGYAYLHLGRYDEARTELVHALDLCSQVGDLVGQALTHQNLAHLYERQGRNVEALDHARQALALYRAADHRSGQAHALNMVGWCNALLGDHEPALAACREALTVLQDLDDRYGQAATWDSLGYIHHQRGQHPDAITCYEHARQLRHDLGDRYYEAATLIHLGDTHHDAGTLDAARDVWQRALTILTDLGHADVEQVRGKLAALDTRSHPA